MSNRYWKDEDTLVPGDILHDTRTNQHFMLLEMIPTSLSHWFILHLETGKKYVTGGIGRNVYETHLKRV